MPVTIYDVAKRAGVGIGTVSRAINDSPNINPATKERIRKIAEELNYKPHSLAQSLARKKTYTIAAVVPFFTNYFFIELFKNIQVSLARHGYDLILYSVDQKYHWEHTLERVLADRRADGVLIVSIGINDQFAEKFADAKFPVVLIDNFHAQVDSIVVANKRAAREATEHLIKLGHKRVGMINGHLSSFPAVMRLQGYKQALVENNLPIDDEILIICDARIGEHGFNENSGYKAMQRMLELGDKMPGAIFVASDVQALGVMRAAKERGIKIPDDLAIVGFDDIEFSKFVGLTTMRQPFGDMGRMAIDRLVDLMDGQLDAGFHRELRAELIVRESCGCRKTFQVNAEE